LNGLIFAITCLPLTYFEVPTIMRQAFLGTSNAKPTRES
jgi:hypothetical protein